MNSYVGMTMVKKEQGQDDSQSTKHTFTLPAYISATEFVLADNVRSMLC